MCYVLDLEDIYVRDFPAETFRVPKQKEEKQYGEYRARRLVRKAWDSIENPSASRFVPKVIS
jgi:hypothetical protein